MKMEKKWIMVIVIVCLFSLIFGGMALGSTKSHSCLAYRNQPEIKGSNC